MISENDIRKLHLEMYALLLRLEKSAEKKDFKGATKWHDKLRHCINLTVRLLPVWATRNNDPMLSLFDNAANNLMFSFQDASGEEEELRKTLKTEDIVKINKIIELHKKFAMDSLMRGKALIAEIKSKLKKEA